jgi:hypothetical protein
LGSPHRSARVGADGAADDRGPFREIGAAAKEAADIDASAVRSAPASPASLAAARRRRASAALADHRDGAGSEGGGEQEKGGHRAKRGAHDESIDVPKALAVVG